MDGCFGPLSIDKTLIENTTYYGEANKKGMFFVTVRTDNGCRKVDFTGTVTADTPNGHKNVELEVRAGDRDGIYIVYVNSTKSFFKKDK
jgi:hypothetical protein